MKTIIRIAPNYRHIETVSVCKCCGRPIAKIDLQESRRADAGYIPLVTCLTPGCKLEWHTLSGTPERYEALDVSHYNGCPTRKAGA